ncbi:AbrB/MazE/SpoVT family DNA-binding domain-containing protein [Marvinbryantia formatexigens]|nr:AbrB/MazE/SpoVT family DNA-binding domain-containing protein [Marvinbryantia formatexigens]UWO23593.1 AbrB/MazE/SpoVT family DNA-binding domain-containing protein [Marvinbryantia formatexigens DSM 14469]SDG83682.1 looped-hinge helix DNA binding domain-containing protein, AbrB family [Marvinbryantia formatexigens]
MKYADICNMDFQGRIVIPAKIRRFLKLTDGEPLQVELIDQEIHLRKCGSILTDYRRVKSFLTILNNSIRHPVCLCSESQVIAAAGAYFPDGASLPDSLSVYMKKSVEKPTDTGQAVFMPPYREPVSAIFPIHTRHPMFLAVLSKDPLTDTENCCAKLIASMLEHEINEKEGE